MHGSILLHLDDNAQPRELSYDMRITDSVLLLTLEDMKSGDEWRSKALNMAEMGKHRGSLQDYAWDYEKHFRLWATESQSFFSVGNDTSKRALYFFEPVEHEDMPMLVTVIQFDLVPTSEPSTREQVKQLQAEVRQLKKLLMSLQPSLKPAAPPTRASLLQTNKSKQTPATPAPVPHPMSAAESTVSSTSKPDCATFCLAIELGGRHTPAALWDDGEVSMVPIEQMSESSKHCELYDLPKLVGRRFSDPMVQVGSKKWSFTVSPRENDGIDVVANPKATTLTKHSVDTLLKARLKQRFTNAKRVMGVDPTSLVFVVPDFVTQDQQKKLRQITERGLGLRSTHLLREADAVRITVAFKGLLPTAAKLMLVGVGDTSSHVTVVVNENDTIKLVATRSIPGLGLNAVTDHIAGFLATKIQRAHGVDPRATVQDRVALREAASSIGSFLTSAEHAGATFRGAAVTCTVTMSAERLDTLLKDLHDKFKSAITEVLQQGGIHDCSRPVVLGFDSILDIRGLTGLMRGMGLKVSCARGGPGFTLTGACIFAGEVGRDSTSDGGHGLRNEWSKTVLNTVADVCSKPRALLST